MQWMHASTAALTCGPALTVSRSNQRRVHETVHLPKPVKSFLYRHFRLAGVVLKGRWWTFLGRVAKPSGEPISLGFVWGAPLPVRQEAEPSDAYVAEVHAAYVKAIGELFERNKGDFGYAPDETLEVVSAKKAL